MKSNAILSLATAMLSLLASAVPAHAGLTLQFIPNPSTAETPATADGFGSAVAATETVISVGCPGDSTKGSNAGAVYQFDAVTGKLLRKIYGYGAAANHRFGVALAIYGNTLVVGAPGFSNDSGIVTYYDATTGALKGGFIDNKVGARLGSSVAISGNNIVAGRPSYFAPADGPLKPTGGAIVHNMVAKTAYFMLPATPITTQNIQLGASVGISGSRILVGAPASNGSGTAQGAVYVFDLNVRSGNDMISQGILTEPTPADNNRFGQTLLVSGNNALIGAPENDDQGGNAGAVYAFNLQAGTPGNALTIPGHQAGDLAGSSMSISGNLVMLGLPGRGDVGKALVLKVDDNFDELTSLLAIEPVTNGAFGRSVAIAGSIAVVGGYLDPAASAKGTVYAYGPLRTPVPFDELYRRNNAMPGIPGSQYGSAAQHSITPDGVPMMTLGFSGANTGKALVKHNGTAAFTLLRSGTALPSSPAGSIADILSVVANSSSSQLLTLLGRGTGITAANDLGFYLQSNTGGTLTRLAQEGDAAGTAKLGSLFAPYQATDTGGNPRTQFVAKLVKGSAAVLPTADSTLRLFNGSTALPSITEGSMAGSVTLGEITQQHSISDASGLFIAGIATTGPGNQGLFSSTALDAPLLVREATLVGTHSASISSFLGVTQNASHYLVKATLKVGTYISVSPVDKILATDNEVLYANTGPSDTGRIVARKGKPITGLPQAATSPTVANSTTIKQFLEFALLNDDSVVTRVVLQGPSVKPVNDIAILAIDTSGAATVLLQEDDPAVGNGGGSIGTITTWEVNPSGQFAALCTLTNAVKGTDQVLLAGDATTASLELVTRKGMIYDTEGSEVVKSIALIPAPASARGVANGALLNGAPRLLADGQQLIFTLTFNDNREVTYQR